MPLVHTEEFKKRQAELNTTHGLSKTKIYKTFYGMKQRCYNKNNPEYKNYGGRGIRICDEWLNDFTKFYEWMISAGWKNRKTGREQTIERNDVNGDYCPENCKLIPIEEQQLNKSNSRRITAFGETKILSQWANETGIPITTIKARIDRLGWSCERAVLEPVKKAKNIDEIAYLGKTKTLNAWAKEFGISQSTAHYLMYSKNMKIEEIAKYENKKRRKNIKCVCSAAGNDYELSLYPF